MYDRHPTVLIFFFLLLSVSEYFYLPGAWPHFTLVHQILGPIAIALPYLFLYLASFTDPGTITPSTHVHFMAQYPYDYTLFHPGIYCSTCRLLKPARSKHCSICKRCVSKLDHHCIFINSCVGSQNHHYFLLLLLTTGILTLYGGCLGLNLISTTIRTQYPLWTIWPFSSTSSSQTWNQYFLSWQYGLQFSVGMGAVTMLALLTSPLVWGLLAYHIWLVYCGTTTNESMKWADYQADMDDGLVFKRKMAPDRPKNPRIEPVWTRWPVESEQVLVRTEDGKPPRGGDLPGIGDWEPVWNLRDVENLYDLGFWDNLLDVLWPGFDFRQGDGEMPVSETRGRTGGRNRRSKKAKTSGAGASMASSL
jgi:palmitoyltransferase